MFFRSSVCFFSFGLCVVCPLRLLSTPLVPSNFLISSNLPFPFTLTPYIYYPSCLSANFNLYILSVVVLGWFHCYTFCILSLHILVPFLIMYWWTSLCVLVWYQDNNATFEYLLACKTFVWQTRILLGPLVNIFLRTLNCDIPNIHKWYISRP